VRKKRLTTILIATAVIILLFGGCCPGVLYGLRPGALALVEASGLLGLCAAAAVMVTCRFIVQAGLVLLCILWLAYGCWLAIGRRRTGNESPAFRRGERQA
jgi:hypothetical protein